jgi:hypothetical protein
MIVPLALIAALFSRPALAATPYDGALAAIKDVGPEQSKVFDALLAEPAAALAGDARAAALLSDHQAALELFRRASQETSDGYLFAPKIDRPAGDSPVPQYGDHLKLFKLLLLEAKIGAARRQASAAHKDLAAAAAFLIQVSRQKTGALIAGLVEQLCLQKLYPVLSESLRAVPADAAYLKAMSAKLGELADAQDFMQAAALEETEKAKGSFRQGTNAQLVDKQCTQLVFWKCWIMRRMEDAEFLAIVYTLFDAAQDEQARQLSAAFRGNAPEAYDAFVQNRLKEISLRQAERDRRGSWGALMDGFEGASPAKRKMAEAYVDRVLAIAVPMYGKLVPRYYVSASMLSVLRTGLAVELYRLAHKRPPEGLDQLVPGLLPAVPTDPFDANQPLRYVKTGKKFKVYGSGPDRKDDAGASAVDIEAYVNDPKRDAGDIVFSD